MSSAEIAIERNESMDMQQILYLVTFFLLYSIFGWILESITKTVAQKKFVNSGFLFGPFCPIYGVGAIIMILLLDSYQGNYITTFLICFFLFSVWEYFVGWLLEKLFHTKYWDYSYYRFHIQGRVCLVNSLTWGFLGVAFIELIHPIVMYGVSQVPVSIINWCTILVSIYMIVDLCITTIKMKNINLKLTKLSEISNTIKEKLEELKTIPERAGKKAKSSETLQTVIEELKQTQTELKEMLEKQTQRLRMAFPSMRSEKINEFLRKKVELKKPQENDKENH